METFQELAKAKELGDFICLYPFRRTSSLALFALVLIGIPITVLMLGVGITFAMGSLEPGLAPRFFGLVLITVGLGFVGFIPYSFIKAFLMSKKRGVHFYEFGLITLQGLRTVAVRYSDILTLRIKIIDYLKENVGGSYNYLGTTCVYTIRTVTGKRVVFGNSYKDIRRLGIFLSDKLVEHRFPEVFEWYLAGDVIEFGKIRIHLDCLKIGRRIIDWDVIKNVKVKEGYLLIMEEEEEWAAYRIKIAEIPNFPLLTELLKQSLKCPVSIG